jgi:hypothetical protein
MLKQGDNPFYRVVFNDGYCESFTRDDLILIMKANYIEVEDQ